MEAADVVNETQQSTIFERVDRWLTVESQSVGIWHPRNGTQLSIHFLQKSFLYFWNNC